MNELIFLFFVLFYFVGVGDLENNGSEFPMQTPRSCSPKTFQYDYAEYPTHQYEELPNKR